MKHEKNYINNHFVNDDQTKKGIKTEGLHSRWMILCKQETLVESTKDTKTRFNLKIISNCKNYFLIFNKILFS